MVKKVFGLSLLFILLLVLIFSDRLSHLGMGVKVISSDFLGLGKNLILECGDCRLININSIPNRIRNLFTRTQTLQPPQYIGPGFFNPPSPCGQTFTIGTGNSLSYTISASTTPGSSLTLNAVGIPAGASHIPSLPTSGNPVSAIFNWLPLSSQSSVFIPLYSATNQFGIQAQCDVTIHVLSACAGSSYTYGNGCTGSSGNIPKLKVFNCPSQGNIINLQLSFGNPNSQAYIFFSLNSAQLQLPNACPILLDPVSIYPFVINVQLNSNGLALVPITIPYGTFGTLKMQAIILDPGASQGYTTTNGVSITIQ